MVRKLRVKLLQHHQQRFANMTTCEPCTDVVFTCPFGHSRKATWPFTQSDTSKSDRCSGCNRPFASKRWSCPCEQSWITCSIHFSCFTVDATNSRKRSTTVSQYTEQQAENRLKVMESRQPNDGKLKLGPTMTRKFPHLALGGAKQQGDNCLNESPSSIGNLQGSTDPTWS